MFDRLYKVKVYKEGEHVPFVEFLILASHVRVEGHTLRADVVTMRFADNEYITIEPA